MKNDFSIRKLVITDLQSYFDLRLESLQNSPTNFMTSYDEEKSSGFSNYQNLLNQEAINNLIFGAFIDNKLVGVVGIYQEKLLKAKHKCNIWGLYVQPKYRQMGLGKALLQEVISYAKQIIKPLVINITVEAANNSAKKLYESFSFKEWGREPKAMQMDGKFFDECHMSLILN